MGWKTPHGHICLKGVLLSVREKSFFLTLEFDIEMTQWIAPSLSFGVKNTP
jgi:hypothetical protein